jgi:DnaJ-domain-containing protein 1
MFELVGALGIGLLTLQGTKLLLARGIVLRSRCKAGRDAKRRPVQQRWVRTEQEARRQQQPEQDSETERCWHRQRDSIAKQSKESWWSVLEVSPYAGADEIRRSYLRKIKQSHPDRVVRLAPEFLPWAERRSKALNSAYAQAKHACGK